MSLPRTFPMSSKQSPGAPVSAVAEQLVQIFLPSFVHFLCFSSSMTSSAYTSVTSSQTQSSQGHSESPQFHDFRSITLALRLQSTATVLGRDGTPYLGDVLKTGAPTELRVLPHTPESYRPLHTVITAPQYRKDQQSIVDGNIEGSNPVWRETHW